MRLVFQLGDLGMPRCGGRSPSPSLRTSRGGARSAIAIGGAGIDNLGRVTRRWDIRQLADAEVERVAAVLPLARLGHSDGFYVVAWHGEEPVGHAHLALSEPPELQDVAVREAHRRLGIGSALTHAAAARAAARGFDRVRVT